MSRISAQLTVFWVPPCPCFDEAINWVRNPVFEERGMCWLEVFWVTYLKRVNSDITFKMCKQCYHWKTSNGSLEDFINVTI